MRPRLLPADCSSARGSCATALRACPSLLFSAICVSPSPHPASHSQLFSISPRPNPPPFPLPPRRLCIHSTSAQGELLEPEPKHVLYVPYGPDVAADNDRDQYGASFTAHLDEADVEALLGLIERRDEARKRMARAGGRTPGPAVGLSGEGLIRASQICERFSE